MNEQAKPPDAAALAERQAIREWIVSYLVDLGATAVASGARDDRVGYQYVLTLAMNFDKEWPTGNRVHLAFDVG